MKQLIAPFLAIGLVACQSVAATGERVDVAIDQSLPQLCDAATKAHFVIATAGALLADKIPRSLLNKEQAAFEAISGICLQAKNVSVVDGSLLIEAAQAYRTYVDVLAALEDAEES